MSWLRSSSGAARGSARRGRLDGPRVVLETFGSWAVESALVKGMPEESRIRYYVK